EKTEGPVSLGASLPNSEMSAPAMNVRPAHTSTIACAASSALAAANASLSPERTACDSALTGGESTVTTAMPSSISRVTTSLKSCICCPLTRPVGGLLRCQVSNVCSAFPSLPCQRSMSTCRLTVSNGGCEGIDGWVKGDERLMKQGALCVDG